MSSLPSIPPAILYLFGLIIVVMGGLRAYHLGWRRRPAGPEAPDTAPTETGEEPREEGDADAGGPQRPAGWSRNQGGGYKRHLAMGLVWVTMGLFLIISTALNSR